MAAAPRNDLAHGEPGNPLPSGEVSQGRHILAVRPGAARVTPGATTVTPGTSTVTPGAAGVVPGGGGAAGCWQVVVRVVPDGGDALARARRFLIDRFWDQVAAECDGGDEPCGP